MNRISLIKKVTNLTGVVLILLGSVPTPVLAQVGSTNLPELQVSSHAKFEVEIATSFSALLGDLKIQEETVFTGVLPDISGKHGDWISGFITGPTLACEGDECTPEPTQEPTEEPAQEPVDEPVETPTDDPAAEPTDMPATEEPAAEPTAEDQCPNDENKVEPGICGCGISDVDSDGDGKKDCEDDCPQDETNTCLDIPLVETGCEDDICQGAEEVTAENDSESVVEVVAQAVEKDVHLTDEDGEPLQMAAQETADLLLEGDPLIVRGGVNYYFLTDCSSISAPDVCTETATPLTDAVAFAEPGETISVAAGTYAENVLVDKNVILIGGSGGVNVNSFTLSAPVTSLASWTNINTDLVYIVTDSDSQGSIQDGIDLVQAGGTVNVGEGTYDEEIVIPGDKDFISVIGDAGDEGTAGTGGHAPILQGDEIDGNDDIGFDIKAGGVTLKGFIIDGYDIGVYLDPTVSQGFDVQNNVIQNNVVGVFNENSNPGLKVHLNIFQDNDYSIVNASGGGLQYIDATNNYWGCEDELGNPMGPIIEVVDNQNNKTYYQWHLDGPLGRTDCVRSGSERL